MSVTTAKWTVEEYHQFVDSGALDSKPVELLQGEIVDMRPEGPLHSNRIRQSAKILRQQLSSRYEISETHPITLDQSEPEPDIAIIQNLEYDTRHPRGEETALVIEFAYSSLDKDLEEKRLAYAGANIPEYWVVNLRDRHVVVFTEPTEGDYQTQTVITEGEVKAQTFGAICLPIATLIGKT